MYLFVIKLKILLLKFFSSFKIKGAMRAFLSKKIISPSEIINFFKLGVWENLYAGFVLHFRVKCINSNNLALIQAALMQNRSFLASKPRKRF